MTAGDRGPSCKPTLLDDLADRVCPPWHREGSAGSHQPMQSWPCSQHKGQVATVLAAIENAGFVLKPEDELHCPTCGGDHA